MTAELHELPSETANPDPSGLHGSLRGSCQSHSLVSHSPQGHHVSITQPRQLLGLRPVGARPDRRAACCFAPLRRFVPNSQFGCRFSIPGRAPSFCFAPPWQSSQRATALAAPFGDLPRVVAETRRASPEMVTRLVSFKTRPMCEPERLTGSCSAAVSRSYPRVFLGVQVLAGAPSTRERDPRRCCAQRR